MKTKLQKQIDAEQNHKHEFGAVVSGDAFEGEGDFLVECNFIRCRKKTWVKAEIKIKETEGWH